MSKVELRKKWWIGARPRTAKGTELERALAFVEAAEGEKLAAALSALAPAIHKARLELKGHKPLLEDLEELESLAEAKAKKVLAELGKARAAAAAKSEREAARQDEGDDEEPSEDKLFDVELHRTTLKRALRQPLVFGFSVGSRAENRALALAVRGNPMKFGKLAKEKGGGAKACFGRLMAAPGENNKLVLNLESPMVPGVAKALRVFFKENRLTMYRKFSVVIDGQEAESQSGDDDDDAAAAGAGAGAADATEQDRDRRRRVRQALAMWIAVKARAEQDIAKVKDGIRKAYMGDSVQWPQVVAGCKAIDEDFGHLGDALSDALDRYVATPPRDRAKTDGMATAALEILDRHERFVLGSAVLRAIDEKEFADVQVHAPVTKALADVRQALS